MKIHPLIAVAGCAVAVAVIAWVAGDLPLRASVQSGLNQLEVNTDVPTGTADVRDSLGDAVRFAVTYTALAAIVTVISGGFLYIVGFGSDTSIQRAKKIFLYTLLGVLVIFFVRVIVAFFTEEVAIEVAS